MIYKGKEITPGLERISRLCELAGHPEDKLRVIHIAGTNGKGSVGSFIVSILREAGYRVGHFHTPSFTDTREEICADGQWISRDEYAAVMERIRTFSRDPAFAKYGSPSPFEEETLAAFLHFEKKRCDYAVIECGLGGRLDATNVICRPALCVLTSIDMDHMAYLGNTRTAIAAEKCGILKEGVPCAALAEEEEEEKAPAETDKTVPGVIREAARKKGCPLRLVSRAGIGSVRVSLEEGLYFDFAGMEDLHVRSAASYQAVNAALAVAAVQSLDDRKADEDAIRRGLAAMRWPGRFEVVSRDPLILYDGAHNPSAAKRLTESILALIPDRPLILIMGVLADKDYRQMLEILAALPARLITFAPASPRALSAADLAAAAAGSFEKVYAAGSLEDARECCKAWKREMPEQTALVQCGTLSAYPQFCSVFSEYFRADEKS